MKTATRKTPWLGGLSIVAVLLFASCDRILTTKVGNIVNRPRDFDGKLVTVAGKVTGGANVIVVKAFTLRDDTGEILVITHRAVPREGTKLRVHGRVDQAFSIGDESLVVLKESAK